VRSCICVLGVSGKYAVMYLCVRGIGKVCGHVFVCLGYQECVRSCICVLGVSGKCAVKYLCVRGIRKVCGHVFVC